MSTAEMLRAELVPVAELVPHPRNPRTITPARLAHLKRVLSADPEMLEARPLIRQASTGYVIAGNQRLAAGTELAADGDERFASMPVVTADLDDDRAIEWALRDNEGFGERDDVRTAELLLELTARGRSLDLTGMTTRSIDAILATQKPKRDPDAVPPAPAKPKSKRGKVYDLGAHRLMCGDSTSDADVATLLGSTADAMLFTSPPYAVGLDYGAYEDTLENLRPLLSAVANLWAPVVGAGGFAVINFGDVITGADHAAADEPCEYPMALEHWPIFRDAGWVLHTRRVWAKPHARVHSPWAIRSNRAASDWEHLWTWKRPGRRLNQRRQRSAFGVWDTSAGAGVDVGKDTHPAGFPAILPQWAIETYTDRETPVVDPFAGTGTTLIAAEMTGRPSLSMEIDPVYCDIVRTRYADFVGRPELRP